MSRSSVTSMFLKSLVSFQCSWNLSNICHRWSLPYLAHFLYVFRMPYSLDFPPAFLVIPQSPCSSFDLFMLGASGLNSLFPFCQCSVPWNLILLYLGTVYKFMAFKFIFLSQISSTDSDCYWQSHYTSLLECLTDTENVAHLERIPVLVTPCFQLYLYTCSSQFVAIPFFLLLSRLFFLLCPHPVF